MNTHEKSKLSFSEESKESMANDEESFRSEVANNESGDISNFLFETMAINWLILRQLADDAQSPPA